jgi:hypothetical protein
VWSHSFITIKFQLAWTNQMIHIWNSCMNKLLLRTLLSRQVGKQRLEHWESMHQAHCISEGKSVHWNSKRMNGTNCEHTEPFNLEMYMGRLKSNVVFSELKASTCIFPMALASIPDV